jgi:hypothetical protein
MTNGLNNKHIWLNICALPHIWLCKFATASIWISLYVRKIFLSFLSVYPGGIRWGPQHISKMLIIGKYAQFFGIRFVFYIFFMLHTTSKWIRHHTNILRKFLKIKYYFVFFQREVIHADGRHSNIGRLLWSRLQVSVRRLIVIYITPFVAAFLQLYIVHY